MSALTPLFVNAWSTTLASSVASGATTTFALTSATGLPTPGANQFIPAVVVDTSTSPETIKEYVYITGLSGTTATVTRAAEDAATYPAGALASGLTVAAVASKNALYAAQSPPAAPASLNGFALWSQDVANAFNNMSLGASGTTQLVKIPVQFSLTLSNIVVYVVATGTALTSGQCFAGLYDSLGNQLAVTADQATAWGTTGMKTMALTVPVTVAGAPAGFIYAAFLWNGTASPSFASTPGGNSTDNLNLSASAFRSGQIAGPRTSLPAAFTLSGQSPSIQIPWVALS